MTAPVDVLVIAAHPDDAEISCGGTILRLTRAGRRVVIADMSRGEMSTYGTAEGRETEAAHAAHLLGVAERVNLGLPDTAIEVCLEHLLSVVSVIRRFKPRVVLTHFAPDAHPDHDATGQLVRRAFFHAGLKKLLPDEPPHRPALVARFLSHQNFEPSFCIDISDVVEDKRRAVRCFASQFGTGDKRHFLSGMDPIDRFEVRNRFFGSRIGVAYAEGFALDGPVHIKDPVSLLG